MFWVKVWFVLALAMLLLVILTHASFQVMGMCFLAWCGGVVSTLALQQHLQATEEVEK